MIRRQWFATAIGDERALLNKANDILQTQQSPTDDHQLIKLLNNLTTTSSANLATAVFYQYLLSHDVHGPFIKQVQSAAQGKSRPLPQMIIVPGMFATEKPELGGDGALLIDIAASLGFTVSTAPTDGKASLAENALALHTYLLSLPDEDFWLVSVSRGSSDVKVMLSHYIEAPYHSRLKQWISVSGIVTGSPLINRVANPKINSFIIRSLSRLRGMSAELPGEFDCSQNYWPEDHYKNSFGITYITPVPLDWHVTPAVQPRYERLAKLGPTDGIYLLADLLHQPGRIYPIWGADHMLRVPSLADHFYRLINYLKDDQ